MPVTFWDLVEQVKRDTGASEAWILKRAELNHGAFTAWRSRGIPVLPPRHQLLKLAQALRVDYEYLINVILHDTGYLPASVAVLDELATITETGHPRFLSRGEAARRGSSSGRASRAAQDAAAEAGDVEGPEHGA